MNVAAFLRLCVNALGSIQIMADYPIHSAPACQNVLRLYRETHHADEHRICGCTKFRFEGGADDELEEP